MTKALNPSMIQMAEHVRNEYHITPEHGVTVEQMKDEAYWAHVSNVLRLKDIINATPEDLSWYAQFIVVSVGLNRAEVKLLNFVKLASNDASPANENYTVRWGSPKTKFRVFRNSDNAVVGEGFDTEVAANNWIISNCG